MPSRTPLMFVLRVLARAAGAAAVLAALTAAPAYAADYSYWYAHPQDRVFKDTLPPPVHGRASGIETSPTPIGLLTPAAAGAEHEGRQLVLRTDRSRVFDLWIGASPLVCTDASGSVVATIPAASVSVYKVGYVFVRELSYGYRDRKRGWFPDPLIPMTLANGKPLGWRKDGTVDPYLRGIEPKTTQPFYVLFRVPADAPAGFYRGSLTITGTGADGRPLPRVEVPVRLTVYPFSIQRRTLRTSFGVSFRLARMGSTTSGAWLKRGSGIDRVTERTSYYADQISGWLRYMSEHRLSPQTLLPAWDAGSDWAPPNDVGEMDAREAVLTDYLGEGTATTFTGDRFGFNTVRMPEFETRPAYITNPFSSPDAELKAALYYRSMASELAPWIKRAYVYAIDEPVAAQRSFVESYGALVHANVRGAKFLVTVDPGEFAFKPLKNVDIYVHKLHYFYRDQSRWVTPLKKQRKQVWIYSHMGTQQAGAPNYLIDKPTADVRAHGWFAYHGRADGLLYYSVNRWAGAVKGSSAYRDPYADPVSLRSSWAGKPVVSNGDGSLVYPGYYPALGLVVQGAPPVGSLRMEALRDGIEDYEYLKLLEAKRGRAAVDAQVRRIVGAPASVWCAGRYAFPWYPKASTPYEAVRRDVARALAATATPSAPPSVTPDPSTAASR